VAQVNEVIAELRVIAYFMQVAILASFFLAAPAWAHCPPCGGHTFLTQLKLAPWANVPPPAPDAPVTPCGCGVDHTTPRDEIQKMPSSDQRSLIGKLSKETAALTEQVDKLKEENGAAMDKLKAKLEKEEKAEKKQREDIEGDQKKRNSEREEAQDSINDDEEEWETVASDIAEHRSTLKELQSELTIRLMEMESCGCKEAKSFLAQTTEFESLSAAHVSGKEEPLYFEIEELEAKRNALNEEMTDEIGSNGINQRNLLHRIDMVEAKMNRQASKADKYEHTDKNLAKGVKSQGKAMGNMLANKKAQLERIEKDTQAAQDKYDDLEKAMKKCGCTA